MTQSKDKTDLQTKKERGLDDERICKKPWYIIDNVLVALQGKMTVGYVRREKRNPHGINAQSLNDAIRNALIGIPGIHGETNVVFGSFLPPTTNKGEFDFSIFDEESNFYNFWNHCYGSEECVRNGDKVVDYYIRDESTKKKWELFIETQKPKKYEEMLTVPSDVFNVLGEIQFGNWAMVYKDMFRLVSAINKKAEIGLYIYIAAADRLKNLLSDSIVDFKDACKRFSENVENHNINKPVMIIPFDVDFEVNEYDFKSAATGYDEVCSRIENYEKKIDSKKRLIKKYQADKKGKTGKDKEKIERKIVGAKTQKDNFEEELRQLKDKYKEPQHLDEY